MDHGAHYVPLRRDLCMFAALSKTNGRPDEAHEKRLTA